MKTSTIRTNLELGQIHNHAEPYPRHHPPIETRWLSGVEAKIHYLYRKKGEDV